MLLVVGAKAAIIRTSPFDRRIVVQWHFRLLDEDFAVPAVVVHVIRDENPFCSMLRTPLKQENFLILKDNFAFQLAETRRANRQRNVIKHVRPHAFHRQFSRIFLTIIQTPHAAMNSTQSTIIAKPVTALQANIFAHRLLWDESI